MINPYMFEILRAAVLKEASDIHYKVHKEPMFRLNGRLVKSGIKAKEFEESKAALYSMMRAHEIELLEKKHEVDFSFVLTDLARFRVNAYQEKDEGLSAAIRLIPLTAPSLELLNLPEAVEKLADARQGLMLITGPTGSGKSTTLAALVDKINTTKDSHVITIEDPLEFVHDSKVSIITQREVGTHVESFILGLRAAMRQDPDVILIGEMRDRETIWTALQACETGHLVFSTFHTSDAIGTINRLVNSFEPHMHDQIRGIIASNLRGILSQRIIPTDDGTARVLAIEVLVNTATVGDYIRRNDMLKIHELIHNGGYDGMQTMNQSLYMLYRQQLISGQTAMSYSSEPAELQKLFSGAYSGTNIATDNSKRWTPYSAMGAAKIKLSGDHGSSTARPPVPGAVQTSRPASGPLPAQPRPPAPGVPPQPPPPQPRSGSGQLPRPPAPPPQAPVFHGVGGPGGGGFSFDLDLSVNKPGQPAPPPAGGDVDIRISLD